MEIETGRKLLSIVVIKIIILFCIIFAYLSIAAMSDLFPFNERGIIEYNKIPLDAQSFINPDLEIFKDNVDFSLSVNDESNRSLSGSRFSLSAPGNIYHVRYGYTIKDKLTNKYLMDTVFTEWEICSSMLSPVSGMEDTVAIATDVSFNISIPNEFYFLGGKIKTYEFVILKEIREVNNETDTVYKNNLFVRHSILSTSTPTYSNMLNLSDTYKDKENWKENIFYTP